MNTNSDGSFCPVCGAELIHPDSGVCGQCGAKLSQDISVTDGSFGGNGASEETVCAGDDYAISKPDGSWAAFAAAPPSDGHPAGYFDACDEPTWVPSGGAFAAPSVPAAGGVPSVDKPSDDSDEPTWVPAPGSSVPGVPNAMKAGENTASSEHQKSVFGDEPEVRSETPEVVSVPVREIQSSPTQQPSYPYQPQSYSNQPQSYPNQPQSYPNQPQSYPNQPQSYPNQPQSYPNQPQSYSNQQPYPYPGAYPGGMLPVSGWQQKQAKANHPFANVNKKKWLVPAIIAAVAGLIIITGTTFAVWKYAIGPRNEYNRACSLLEEGKYDDAIEIFGNLGSYKDSEEMITESKYQKARSFLENGEYSKAEEMFRELGSYKDSADMVLESKYRYGLSLLENKEYTKAVSVFEELGDYSDSRDCANKAKFMYCQANANCTDTLTYEYLKYLTDISYAGSDTLYHQIYDIRINVAFLNSDKNDKTTINNSTSIKDRYFHVGFDVYGGTPGENLLIYRVITYPGGERVSSVNDPWKNVQNATRCSIYWSEGIYKNPEYGKTGNMYIDIYNKKTNKRIKRITVAITN